MLCAVVVVFTLTGLCRGNSDNSWSLPQLPPPPTVSQRMSQAQVASLRRQLMRDNYDYEHFDDDRTQQNVTETNVDDAAKFYDPQGGADHLHRASELDQPNVNSFSVELGQQDQYGEQDRQHQQGGKQDQPVLYEQRRRRGPGQPHEQFDNNENHGQSEQPSEHEQPDQYDQQGPRKQQHQLQQRGQNEQLDKYKHRGPNTQPGEHEQGRQYEQREELEQPGKHKLRYQYNPPDQHKQRGQLEHRNQDVERGPHEQRGQNAKRRRHRELGIHLERRQNDQREFVQPQEQLGQFDEQEPSMERTDRAEPLLTNAPPAPPDELTVRDVREREYPQAPHAAHLDWSVENYNNRRDTYEPEPKQRRPFGDLRGSYPEEPFPQADVANDQRVQKEQATENDAQSPEQEHSSEQREVFDRQAFERQEMSGSENEGPDSSDSWKQPDARYDELQPHGRQYSRVTRSTHANRLQYYTPPPTRRAPPPQYDRMPNAPPYRHRETPLGRHHSAPRDHNNSKKDLLYYMDDNQLRHHMSPGVPDDDQSTGDEPLSPQPTAGSLHNTTGIHPNPAGNRDSTVSTRPSPVGIRPSPVSSRAGPIGPQVNRARSQARPTAAGSLHNTTGIYPNLTVSRYSTVSARPSPAGIRTSPITSWVGPSGPRVNPAGFQASPTGSRLSSVGSSARLASTHSEPPRQAGTAGPPDLPCTEHARSFVVTVSPNNVTYKLWTLKSREGRRRVDRRLLEERGPGGVAIISLDRAPLPAFRLPRARRQYMHDHHHRRHKLA